MSNENLMSVIERKGQEKLSFFFFNFCYWPGVPSRTSKNM